MSHAPDITTPPPELAAFFSLRDWPSMAEELRRCLCEAAEISRAAGREDAFGGAGVVPLVELERQAIRHALKVTGSVSKAAKLLGIGRMTIYRRMAELNGEGVSEGARAQGGETP